MNVKSLKDIIRMILITLVYCLQLIKQLIVMDLFMVKDVMITVHMVLLLVDQLV